MTMDWLLFVSFLCLITVIGGVFIYEGVMDERRQDASHYGLGQEPYDFCHGHNVTQLKQEAMVDLDSGGMGTAYDFCRKLGFVN